MIETGIPLPSPHQRRAAFPELDQLEVGESVSFDLGYRDRIINAVAYLQFSRNKKFARRTEGSLVRVWRLA
jgi:hypothetical protein